MTLPHWDAFLTFGALELSTGGPDPHLALAACGMGEVSSVAEKGWRAGCYVAPYEVSTGAILWSHWPLDRVERDPDGFRRWIVEHWQGLQIRRERRAARTVVKLAESLLSLAQWCREGLPLVQGVDYETLWKSADSGLRYFGRYALIKILETLHRGAVVQARIPDIRPAGAWSPRATLALLYPEVQALLQAEARATLPQVNHYAEDARTRLSGHVHRAVSHFELEVLLCNYRQALERKYPGRPQDTDLGYHAKVAAYWGADSTFPFAAFRRRLFPAVVLGELQGWSGPREELGVTYPRHGYFWCDTVYDYKATTDLAHPMVRGPVRRTPMVLAP